MTKSSTTSAFIVALAMAANGAVETLAQEEVRVSPQQAADYARYEALQQEAMQLNSQGRWREAVEKIREAIPCVERVLGKVNPQTFYAWDFAAKICTDNGDYPGAVQARRNCLATAQGLYKEEPWLIADAKQFLSHAERLAQLTPAELKKFDESNRLWSEMMTKWKSGDVQGAFDAGQKDVALRTELLGADNYYASGDLFLLGRIVFDGRDFATAQKLFEEHLKSVLSTCGEVHPRTASAYGWIGSALFEQGDYRQSLETRLKALSISRQVHSIDDSTLSDDVAHVAHTHLKLAQHDEALALFEETLQLVEGTDGADSFAYAESLVNVATAKYTSRKYAEAREDFERVIKLLAAQSAETEGRDHALSGALNNYGSMCKDLADLGRARQLLTQSLETCQQSNDTRAADMMPAILNQLGSLEAEVGNWPPAMDFQQRALALARERWSDNHPDTLTILHEFGMLLWENGYLAQARANLETALRGHVATLGEKHETVAKSISTLSRLYLALGDRAKAVEYAEMAILMARRATGDDSETTASCYQDAASLLDPQKDFDLALEWMEKVVAIRRKIYGAENQFVASALGDLANVYANANQLDKAVETQRRAVEMRRAVPESNSASMCVALYNLAVLEQRRGETKTARDLFAETVAIADDKLPELHPNLATYLVHLALSEARLGRYKTSWPLLHRATLLRHRTFAEELPALSTSQMTDFVDSLDDAFSVLLSLPPDVVSAEDAADCVLKTKSRVFNMLCQLKAAERAMKDDPKFEQRAAIVKSARERVSRLTISPPAGMDAAELEEEFAAAKRELNQAETAANILVSAKLGDSPPVTVETVRAKLPKDSALVEIVAYDPINFATSTKAINFEPPKYVAFVVFADAAKPVQRIDLGDAEAINSGVAAVARQFRAARDWHRRSDKTTDEPSLEAEYRTAASPLHQTLFRPLAEALGDVTLVYLAPDEDLHGLPFEALVDDEGRYLVEKGYRFVYLTSGRDLLAPTYDLGKGTAIFAGPNFDLAAGERARLSPWTTVSEPRSRDSRGLKWDSLPGFLAEGSAAAKLLDKGSYTPVASYTGDRALEDVFKRLRDVRAVVVITHGYFLEKQRRDPADLDMPMQADRGGMNAAIGLGRLRRSENPLLRSGLVFCGANRAEDEPDAPAGPDESGKPDAVADDGWLTAYELAGVDLRGVEVAVLSACNSGRGAAQGSESIAGLRTAFLAAGAQSLVASLFEVPDEETAALMEVFYKDMAAGQSSLAALNHAELAAIEGRRAEHAAAHPFYWASFVVAGRP